MLSDTLQAGLERYDIGNKLRRLRLKKKIGLVELGKHTGLSAAMLSKVETGRLFPTLPTLFRIALVFGIGLEHFFSDIQEERVFEIIRKKERLRFEGKSSDGATMYEFESLDFRATDRRMNAYLAVMQPIPLTDAKSHEHPGFEFIYVAEGRLGLLAEGGENELGTGDSVYFDSTIPHAYRSLGRKKCMAIVVTST